MTTPRPPIERAIPLARPDIGARELELVTEVLTSDTLAMGPFAHQFEASIAALTGRREAVACSSGTRDSTSAYAPSGSATATR